MSLFMKALLNLCLQEKSHFFLVQSVTKHFQPLINLKFINISIIAVKKIENVSSATKFLMKTVHGSNSVNVVKFGTNQENSFMIYEDIEAPEKVDNMVTKQSTEKLDCSKCKKLFSQQDDLKNHLKACTLTYTCHSCNKIFSNKSNLVRHQLQCNKEGKTFECDRCQDIMPSKK